MLRTNQTFLGYVKELYDNQQRRENILEKQYSKGQKLFFQNERATKVMFIKEGVVKCFFTEDNGKEYILEFLGKGEIIGEIEFIRKIVSLCNIEAMTDVTVYAVSPGYFAELIKNDIKLNNLLLDAFAERIINTASRASFQQLYTIEHSLAKLLELLSKQDMHMSKEDIASYLGITVRSLNRAFKGLSE